MLKKKKKNRIWDTELCIGKTVAYIHDESNTNITIFFTDGTYIEFIAGYNGSHETIGVFVPREVTQRIQSLKIFGVKCEKCDYLWLPRNFRIKPKACPKCSSRRILDINGFWDEEEISDNT